MGLTDRMNKVGMVDQALAFWGLGQVGVAIKGPTGVLYVDPYLTDSDGEGGRLERSFPPPLEPEEVTNASAVVLTRDHVDHTDPETLLPLTSASPQARFVCPSTSRDTLVESGPGSGPHYRPRGRRTPGGRGGNRHRGSLRAHGARA
jgi:L-ascorbate 6-phosphate lactonase